MSTDLFGLGFLVPVNAKVSFLLYFSKWIQILASKNAAQNLVNSTVDVAGKIWPKMRLVHPSSVCWLQKKKRKRIGIQTTRRSKSMNVCVGVREGHRERNRWFEWESSRTRPGVRTSQSAMEETSARAVERDQQCTVRFLAAMLMTTNGFGCVAMVMLCLTHHSWMSGGELALVMSAHEVEIEDRFSKFVDYVEAVLPVCVKEN